MSENEEMVTISKNEYDSLIKDSNILRSLEAAGVDNWEGYDYAWEIYHEEFSDDK